MWLPPLLVAAGPLGAVGTAVASVVAIVVVTSTVNCTFGNIRKKQKCVNLKIEIFSRYLNVYMTIHSQMTISIVVVAIVLVVVAVPAHMKR
jgi:nitrate/nitrite transporter NarK